MISKKQIEYAVLLGAVPMIPGAKKYYKWLKYLQGKENVDSDALKAFKELEMYFDGEWINSDMSFIEEYINTHPLSEIKKYVLTAEEYATFISEIQNLFCDYDLDTINSISDTIIAADPTSREEYDSMSMKEAFMYDFENNLRLLTAERVNNATSNYQYLMNHRYRQAGPSKKCI